MSSFTWGDGGGIAPAGVNDAVAVVNGGTAAAVPEPSTWVLLGLALLSLLTFRRRR